MKSVVGLLSYDLYLIKTIILPFFHCLYHKKIEYNGDKNLFLFFYKGQVWTEKLPSTSKRSFIKIEEIGDRLYKRLVFFFRKVGVAFIMYFFYIAKYYLKTIESKTKIHSKVKN